MNDCKPLSPDEVLLLSSIDDDLYGFWEIPIEFCEIVADRKDPSVEIMQAYRPKVILWISDIYKRLLEN